MSLQQNIISNSSSLERSTIAVENSAAFAKADGCALMRRIRRDNAFSLIEVVMAIGIVAFAFVCLLGLLPIGLASFRQSIDATIGSQIVQRVVNEAQQTDYTSLINSGTTQRYFDDQANEVTAANANNSIYTVQVTVSGTTALPNSAGVQSSNLATVSVQIADNPGHVAAPFASTSTIPSSTYTALIARNQTNSQPDSQSDSGVTSSQSGSGSSGSSSTQTTNPNGP